MNPSTLDMVLQSIHNHFEASSFDVRGCSISGGVISADIPNGAWYRIDGSLLNDGMHKHPDTTLEDETFDGTITICRIPKPLLDVVEEVDAYLAASSDALAKVAASPYASESFGGYSYSLRSDLTGGGSGGGAGGWQSVFARRLRPWRKLA